MEQNDKDLVQCIRCHKILEESKCTSFQGYVFCIKDCGKRDFLDSKDDVVRCSECSKFCFKSSSIAHEQYFFCSDKCANQGRKTSGSLLVNRILL